MTDAADSRTPNAPIDETDGLRLWNEYRAARPDRAVDPEPPSIERFGDHAELTDELLGLVLDGTKTATASLVAEFALEGQPLPRIGSHWIACDSAGQPRVVLRSTELRIGPFTSVDERFAYDEGEDDRTLASWREGHRRYWTRVGDALGFEWTERHDIVFERFEVAWRADSSTR
ncbi:ASCH domain-containing protein [Agromyces aerolatus]|uniref:ASCH domain-containing protein n=1 Tax=Agromyces sp. LY-1074 TaxID=3074080 RepID=UPI00286020EA|nr:MULTISPECIES: ASCH domain-containing protein [unclassified Agromyces]MDR5699196.1 ASCH domain-containing protein [Agromyces sp. LY-1074]MDR5705491.1 ASCH domain-containing protein [Agromyces sp. LY-1358]